MWLVRWIELNNQEQFYPRTFEKTWYLEKRGGDKQMAITFGRYKDHDLANIPTNYLEWLMVNVKDLMEPLKSRG